MRILTSLNIASKALVLHKVRSALTVLGLIIGVASIITVVNTGDALKHLIVGELEAFGTDYINIEIKVPSTGKNSTANAAGIAQGVSITTLTLDDAEAIANLPNVRDYYAGIVGQDIAAYGRENKTASLWGVSPSFFELFNAELSAGRPFLEDENLSQSRVAVIGSAIAEDIFGLEDPVGKRIKIGSRTFRVAGVMSEQGSLAFLDMDNTIYIPVTTMQRQVLGVRHIQFILAYLNDPSLNEVTAADIESLMRERHDITDPDKDDFAVTTAEEGLAVLDSVTSAITLLLFAIAAISLMVGGVGIMNIMYVSVAERTYEIGLRKSVGATKSDILWQFLWESLLLTLLGGFIGVVIGEAISLAASAAASSLGYSWPFSPSLSGLVLGVGFSMVVGLVFGIYPAKQASILQPVDALREQ